MLLWHQRTTAGLLAGTVSATESVSDSTLVIYDLMILYLDGILVEQNLRKGQVGCSSGWSLYPVPSQGSEEWERNCQKAVGSSFQQSFYWKNHSKGSSNSARSCCSSEAKAAASTCAKPAPKEVQLHRFEVDMPTLYPVELENDKWLKDAEGIPNCTLGWWIVVVWVWVLNSAMDHEFMLHEHCRFANWFWFFQSYKAVDR